MYCIAFNGPPHCGKDTIANHIFQSDNLIHIASTLRGALSLPLRIRALAMLGVDYRHTDPDHIAYYERIKDVPQEIWNERTLRQEMIRDSEQNLKLEFGQDVLAKAFLNRIGGSLHLPGLMLLSDSGFQPETDTLVEAFGPENFLVVQLARTGCDFTGDSRGYVTAPNMLHVFNDQTVEWAAEQVITLVTRNLSWNL